GNTCRNRPPLRAACRAGVIVAMRTNSLDEPGSARGSRALPPGCCGQEAAFPLLESRACRDRLESPGTVDVVGTGLSEDLVAANPESGIAGADLRWPIPDRRTR